MPTTRPLEERFWEKVKRQPLGCWPWTASTKMIRYKNGNIFNYGQIRVKRKEALAHRVSWELTNGPIPGGFFVCHSCDNPRCVRPSHLFLGTPRDNTRDMIAKGRSAHRNALGKRKSHCKNGHPMSGDNLRLHKRKGGDVRECVACARATALASYDRRRDDICRQRFFAYQPKSNRKRTSRYLN